MSEPGRVSGRETTCEGATEREMRGDTGRDVPARVRWPRPKNPWHRSGVMASTEVSGTQVHAAQGQQGALGASVPMSSATGSSARPPSCFSSEGIRQRFDQRHHRGRRRIEGDDLFEFRKQGEAVRGGRSADVLGRHDSDRHPADRFAASEQLTRMARSFVSTVITPQILSLSSPDDVDRADVPGGGAAVLRHRPAHGVCRSFADWIALSAERRQHPRRQRMPTDWRLCSTTC